MNGPQSFSSPRRIPTARRLLVLCGAGLACLSLLLAAPAAMAAEETVKYIHESIAEYEKQLAAGEITSAVVNRRARSVHLNLKSGQKGLINYGKGQEQKYVAQLQAKHVPVSELKPAAAQAEFKKESHPVHHKLRYIVGGIAIAVIVVIAAVLLFNRRRRLAAE